MAGLTSVMYGRVIVLVGQITSVPILATHWGTSGYGEWLALTAAASYAAYGGAGLAPSIRADMAMAPASGDADRMQETFQSALTYLAIVGCGLIAIALLISSWAPLTTWLQIESISARDAGLIVVFLTTQIALGLLNGVCNAALAVVGRFALANVTDATRVAVEFGSVGAAVIWLQASPLQVSQIYATSSLMMLIFNFTVLKLIAPQLVTSAWRFSTEALSRVWRPTLDVLTMNFGYSGLMIQAPRIILASALGPSAVATYAVAVMFIRILRMVLEVPGVAVTVEISRAYATDNLVLLRSILTLASRSTFWAAVVSAPFVVVLGPDLIQGWSNGRLHTDVPVLLILSVSTCFFAASLPSYEALIATKNLGLPARWLLGAACPFLLLCWLGSRFMGVEGAALSVALFEILMTVTTLRTAAVKFNFSGSDVVNLFRPPNLAELAALRSMISRR